MNPWELQYTAQPDQQPQQQGPWQQQYGQPQGIDYSGPVADVRQQIMAMPEEQQRVAMREWADARERQAADQGGATRGFGSAIRTMIRGVPGGTWSDELFAGI